MFRLDDKVVVLVGGNGYLGRNFSKAILEFGGTLHTLDIDTTEHEDATELKQKYPDRYNLHKVDCTRKDEIAAAREVIFDKEKRVDVLINTTTMKSRDFYLPFEEVSLEGWDIGLLGNLTIPFLTIQAFIPIMVKQQSGSIINIASHYGIVGNDQRIYEGSNLHEVYTKDNPNIKRVYSHGVYNAAKGGLINFTRYLAAYYGKDNIRVNSVHPAFIWTPLVEDVAQDYPEGVEAFRKHIESLLPVGHFGEPDDVAYGILYLASDESRFVTGSELVIDGGYIAR